MRIFRERGIHARGMILPHGEFRLFSDVANPEILPERMGEIIKRAEELNGTEPTVIPLSAFRKYEEDGQITPYSSPWGSRLNALFYLGMAEGYERGGRFLETLTDYIWATLEMATWMLPEHTAHAPYGKTKVPAVVGDRYVHGMELGSIYLAATLATVYHYNKEALAAISPVIPERIEYELHHRIVMPYINCDFTWEGDRGNKVNNWCPWNISNILLVTALTEKNIELRERVVELALRHVDNFVSFYKPDGGCDEGPTYWGAAAGSLFDCLEMLEDMSGGKINVYDEPLIRAMGEYIAKFSISGHSFVNFADSHATCHPEGSHLIRFGEKCHSELLINFGRRMEQVDSSLHFRHPYRTVRNLITPIYRGKAPELAARSVYFPDLCVMIERESEVATEGLLLAIKGGHNGESHNHNDVGSFIVYKDGKPLIIDAGVGAYTKQTFSSRRYELWFMQSNYHNVAAFDGIGQMQGERYAASGVSYNPKERSFTAELAGAYPEAAGVKSYVRRAALGEGEVTVQDTISLDKEREIDFVFLVRREPRLGEGNTVLLDYGCVLEYDSDGFTAEIEELEPVGMDTVQMWDTERLWRIHLKAKKQNADISVRIR